MGGTAPSLEQIVMKVVHINTMHNVDGAARAAYRLHCGLRRLGHTSVMFVANRTNHDSTATAFRPPKDLPGRLRRYLRMRRITRNFAHQCWATKYPTSTMRTNVKASTLTLPVTKTFLGLEA